VQRPLQNQEAVREIHTIFDKIAGGGESNSARKAYARSIQGEEVYSLHRPMKAAKIESIVLSFSEEDAQGVVMPHDDALVVTVTVANPLSIRSWLTMGALPISYIGQPSSIWESSEIESNHLVLFLLDLTESRSSLLGSFPYQ
jgi:hypothetical protein